LLRRARRGPLVLSLPLRLPLPTRTRVVLRVPRRRAGLRRPGGLSSLRRGGPCLLVLVRAVVGRRGGGGAVRRSRGGVHAALESGFPPRLHPAKRRR
jgi:hypothetical protein